MSKKCVYLCVQQLKVILDVPTKATWNEWTKNSCKKQWLGIQHFIHKLINAIKCPLVNQKKQK